MPELKNIKFEGDILALMPEKFKDVLAVRDTYSYSSDVDVDAAMAKTASKFKDIKGSIVTVPLYGYISHKPTIWSALGMETSSETFASWIDDLMENPRVGALVLDIDSPGGTVAGVSSVAERIFSYRGRKPMVAVVNDLMASAAYWIGSAADEIVADPDSLTGSIGVFGMHVDYSKALEDSGVKVTFIKAGKFKTDGNPYEPLSEEALAHEQEMVDGYYNNFTNAVAKHRGVSQKTVDSSFGQGRVFTATKAKTVGMVDRVASYKQVVDRLRTSKSSKVRAQMVCDLLNLEVD